MPAEVVERLQFELSTIKTWGVQEYFLFWQELVNVVQNELGALTGPGRGPAVGCLVNYCLGITKIDPIKNGLLFERFIDPDHICMPTIELDIDTVGHEKVLQWLKDKYGEDKIKAHMGDKEEISVEGVKVKWTKYNTTRFDTKSFKAEHAAMYAQYAKASEARRFSVN